MPAVNKSKSTSNRKPIPSPDLIDPEDIPQEEEEAKVGRKKAKHAAAKQSSCLDNAEESPSSEQMGQQSRQPAKPQSILGQLKSSFPQSDHRNDSSDAVNEVDSTRKVFDEHTPPTHVWARGTGYGRSPPVEPIPGFSSGTPPYEPGFSTRGSFARSPPLSPPSRKARPVSYGGGVPPLPPHHRMSTSPYSYAVNAYGSPPIPPHLPQQHFYGPHDVDLGLANATAQMNVKDPVALKFSRHPTSGNEAREAVFMVGDEELNVLTYNGEKLEHSGFLGGVRGEILDVCLLTWNTGDDPFVDYRPLVAITVHGPNNVERENGDGPLPDAAGVYLETKVAVYSMGKGCHVADLLCVPSPMRMFHGGGLPPGSAANLKTHASGNAVVVSSGDSGEVFVFSARKNHASAAFECLGKFWTSIQPQIQRRDSSQPTSDAEISPADLGRGVDADGSAIISLSGRWLAICPAGTPSRRSIGALIGESVIHSKHAHISTGTAPSRPPVTCEVESPDVDTFFGKVAKGIAQEAVRSAKWIGEKGVQTWQNYWKKDSTADSLPTGTSSSPPVYSPQFGMAQFPPTHAMENPNVPKDPDVVSILDLKSLQDTQGRRGVDLNPIATFQPPRGCSFLSFTPSGLGLLTANRKGDVQYVWDLQQMRHVRVQQTTSPPNSGYVRQVARYERLSPSTIVDLAWDGPTGYRFALLTKNRTVHIFDLPKIAFQWPPPPTKRNRPSSAPVEPPQAKPEQEPAPTGGFFASAMSIAGRTQPMLANLRGRAPSINSSGITGFTASGIGLSTTGLKSGRAVAAGLSKSLGAASETVTNIRHANQSRLYLKIPARPGMLCWQRREGRSVLSILDLHTLKDYYVRMTKPREDRHRQTVSVFDARKPVVTKFPKGLEMTTDPLYRGHHARNDDKSGSPLPAVAGFWRSRASKADGLKMSHPLASAEIETNAPYQPFHCDHRVTISLLEDRSSKRLPSSMTGQQSTFSQRHTPDMAEKWVFGEDIRSQQVPPISVEQAVNEDDTLIYRETKITSGFPISGSTPVETLTEGVNHAVSNTKKRKSKKNKTPALVHDEDTFIEADADFVKSHDEIEQDLNSRKGQVFDLLEDEDMTR
ncbi:hypothetical protein PV08_04339 [Exophiala spinifera]|uniref:BCAS3 domain-containing protein n=1 Tax=Exophiala spinifera TaxID=91928 RepID=A0A0D2BDW4_9EURO|nr:uncharacterized protein PV08_04339 [Exophiala spinifera]KIW17148.1 hypothetical protein PV08_04339 [Exophiala spinifera]